MRAGAVPPSEFGGKGTKSVQTDWNRAAGLWITKGHETRKRDIAIQTVDGWVRVWYA